MADVYILKNQYDLFLDRQGDWVDRAQSASLYRTVHRDEAINSMVELSVKNPDLRVKIETCSVNAKGHLVLDVENPEFAPPLPAIDPV